YGCPLCKLLLAGSKCFETYFAFTFAPILSAEGQKILRRKHSIRTSFAFFLLLVFALSATPEVLFHEALAPHTDGPVCQDRDKSETHLHQPAFHCCFDDLVVSSPYISFDLNAVASPLCYYFTPGESSVTYIFSSFFLHQEDRGPPRA
ncbi:MAG TPA: hypothetical protein VEX65_01560, partial [Flavisolibacter sp.]|nr:hypothetical protein [Flavisolibacter sp.]